MRNWIQISQKIPVFFLLEISSSSRSRILKSFCDKKTPIFEMPMANSLSVCTRLSENKTVVSGFKNTLFPQCKHALHRQITQFFYIMCAVTKKLNLQFTSIVSQSTFLMTVYNCVKAFVGETTIIFFDSQHQYIFSLDQLKFLTSKPVSIFYVLKEINGFSLNRRLYIKLVAMIC